MYFWHLIAIEQASTVTVMCCSKHSVQQKLQWWVVCMHHCYYISTLPSIPLQCIGVFKPFNRDLRKRCWSCFYVKRLSVEGQKLRFLETLTESSRFASSLGFLIRNTPITWPCSVSKQMAFALINSGECRRNNKLIQCYWPCLFFSSFEVKFCSL